MAPSACQLFDGELFRLRGGGQGGAPEVGAPEVGAPEVGCPCIPPLQLGPIFSRDPPKARFPNIL